MCGIVGYIGDKEAFYPLLEGLKRLEYRGYDSAGIAVFDEEKESITVVKKVGKIRVLEDVVLKAPPKGKLGIAHTRWATHGRPSDLNAHPHRAGKTVLVHNGIVENFVSLREELEEKGRSFVSETDTEVIAHLLDVLLEKHGDVKKALMEAYRLLKGAYALAVIDERFPGLLIGVRVESPLVVGIGEGEYFLASDVPACLSYTRDFVFLEDGEFVLVRRDGFEVFSLKDGKKLEKAVKRIDWSPSMAEKMGYKHFMEKEIFEQPRVVRETLMGRLFPEEGKVHLGVDYPEAPKKIFIVACGTSYHAGLVGKYWIEALSRTPVEVDIASEFRYRDPIIGDGDVIIPISQSGETADTLSATRIARDKGAFVLSICNVMESSLTRISHSVLYTHAGPEIGVASTKAFTAQLAVLFLIAMDLGVKKGVLSPGELSLLSRSLYAIPDRLEEILDDADSVKSLAEDFFDYSNFLYLGRGLNYPIALEGALKLKEISYIHAEGYPAGEMKHGPIALIDENMPVMVIAPKDPLLPKVLGNIEEVKSRKGIVIAVKTRGVSGIKSDFSIPIPDVPYQLTPFVTTIPLQLFAYYVADIRGTDVDQPRNLAKSVTVE